MYPNAHGYNFTNTSSDMRCGASHGDTSIWRIEDCAQRKMFVCEMRTGKKKDNFYFFIDVVVHERKRKL